jgi:hypothetical protein
MPAKKPKVAPKTAKTTQTPQAVENKSGPYSDAEKRYISDYYVTKSPEDIAKVLKRNPDAIKKYIKKKFGKDYRQASIAEQTIRTSPVWAELRNQFSPDELNMFMHHYGKILVQFKDDVFHTEEIQVIDLVKLQILMDRLLTQERKTIMDIEAIEAQIEDLKEIGDPSQKQLILELERQVGMMRGGVTETRKMYQAYATDKARILTAMKATREARIKNIEGGKSSYSNWMKELILNKDKREEFGLYMEKMRLATTIEFERLSELHTYGDDKVDQPILTPENVIGGN